MPEVAFFYCDLGVREPDYGKLSATMVRSLRSHAPDVRVVQLSDMRTPRVDGVDTIARLDEEVTSRNIMLARMAMFSKHIRHANGPTIYCDVDSLWLRAPDFSMADFDIGVLYRAGQPAMPYVGCMIYTRPNERAIRFWAEWSCLMQALPDRLHSWWGDQVSLALLLGLDGMPGDRINVRGCRVGILDAYEHAMIPSFKDQDMNAAMVHFKGKSRKEMMNGREPDGGPDDAAGRTGSAADGTGRAASDAAAEPEPRF